MPLTTLWPTASSAAANGCPWRVSWVAVVRDTVSTSDRSLKIVTWRSPWEDSAIPRMVPIIEAGLGDIKSRKTKACPVAR